MDSLMRESFFKLMTKYVVKTHLQNIHITFDHVEFFSKNTLWLCISHLETGLKNSANSVIRFSYLLVEIK